MLKNKPKPSPFLLLLCVLLMVMGVVIYSRLLHRQATTQVTVDSLSPRAQEFIAEERSDGNGLWSTVDVNEETTEPLERWVHQNQLVTPCFSLTLPSAAKTQLFEESDTQCRWEGKLSRPLTHLVIGRTIPTSSLSENTGVVLRRRSPDIYQELEIKLDTFDEVRLFRSSEDLTLFAQTETYLYTLGFTHSSNLDAIDMMSIRQMLESLP